MEPDSTARRKRPSARIASASLPSEQRFAHSLRETTRGKTSRLSLAPQCTALYTKALLDVAGSTTPQVLRRCRGCRRLTPAAAAAND